MEHGGNLIDTDIVIKSEKTGRFRVVREAEYLIEEFFFNGERITFEDAMFIVQYLGQPVARDVSAGSERAFLSAIMEVSDMTPIRVAFTQGFGEFEYSAMRSLLQRNGFMVEEIDMLMAAEIDPEIDFIVIFSPAYDYSLSARALLDSWLDNDGRYGKTLLYFPAPEMPQTPNLDAFTEEWGLRAEYGFVVQDNDFYAFPGDEHRLIQFVRATGEAFSDSVPERTLFATAIRPITQLFETRPSQKTTVIAESYDGSFYHPLYDIEEDTALFYEILNVIAMSQKTRYEGFEELTSRVILFGSPSFFIGETLLTEQFSNAVMLLNIFNDISGRSDISVTVIPKSFVPAMFEITLGDANRLMRIFVLYLPLLIITTGLVVYFRRRYR
jgi:hypothetical protein